MKFLLFLLELLLLCYMLNALAVNVPEENETTASPAEENEPTGSSAEENETTMSSPNTESEPETGPNAEPEAPSDRMLSFMSMLNGVFSTIPVENCVDVTKPRDVYHQSVFFKQIEVPALSPANTILYYGVRNATILFEQILAVTELNRLIYVHVYHNLKNPAPRKIGEEVYDLTNLTLSDLKKRCDCTRVFNQQGPNDFKGVWPVCYLTEQRFPDYQSSRTCNGFRIIGRLDYQRVACCGRFPMATKLMGREETFSAPCGSGRED